MLLVHFDKNIIFLLENGKRILRHFFIVQEVPDLGEMEDIEINIEQNIYVDEDESIIYSDKEVVVKTHSGWNPPEFKIVPKKVKTLI